MGRTLQGLCTITAFFPTYDMHVDGIAGTIFAIIGNPGVSAD
jgi:hypothetical protein